MTNRIIYGIVTISKAEKGTPVVRQGRKTTGPNPEFIRKDSRVAGNVLIEFVSANFLVLSLFYGGDRMSRTPFPGSREMPLVVEVGEIAHLNYRAWRGGKSVFFRIRLKNGQLSPLIDLPNSGFQFPEEITATCHCCGEKVRATIFFF